MRLKLIEQSRRPSCLPTKAHMPDATTYEAEYQYWPWGLFIDYVADWVCENSPTDGKLIDYMCGTGLLLRKIQDRRPDLRLSGCDISASYVEHAVRIHGLGCVEECDALSYSVLAPLDLILCTAGLHHLTRGVQETFLDKAARELRPEGILVLGEEVIGPFASELERRLSVLELNHALLEYAVRGEATKPVLTAATDVLANDLLERGEYKSSLDGLVEMVDRFFIVETIYRYWPADSARFGDVLLICKKKLVKSGNGPEAEAET